MRVDDFRGFLRDVAEVAGPDVALAIIKARGGDRAYFPSLRSIDNGKAEWLVAAIGVDAVRKIASEIIPAQTGCFVHIPLRAAREIGRRERILSASREGKSVSAVAREIGVSVRLVYLIRAELKKEGLL